MGHNGSGKGAEGRRKRAGWGPSSPADRPILSFEMESKQRLSSALHWLACLSLEDVPVARKEAEKSLKRGANLEIGLASV